MCLCVLECMMTDLKNHGASRGVWLGRNGWFVWFPET